MDEDLRVKPIDHGASGLKQSYLSVIFSLSAVAVMLIGTSLVLTYYGFQPPMQMPIVMWALIAICSPIGTLGVLFGVRAYQTEKPRFIAIIGMVIGGLGWLSVLGSYGMWATYVG